MFRTYCKHDMYYTQAGHLHKESIALASASNPVCFANTLWRNPFLSHYPRRQIFYELASQSTIDCLALSANIESRLSRYKPEIRVYEGSLHLA